MAKTVSKGLTKAQLRHFTALLEAKAEEIRANLRSAAASKALSYGEDPADLEELPGQSHEEWIFVNRNNIDTMLLREIEDALLRIDDGTYGTCLECEHPISMKRLDALAWARYCVPCQECLSASQQSEDARSYSYRQ